MRPEGRLAAKIWSELGKSTFRLAEVALLSPWNKLLNQWPPENWHLWVLTSSFTIDLTWSKLDQHHVLLLFVLKSSVISCYTIYLPVCMKTKIILFFEGFQSFPTQKPQVWTFSQLPNSLSSASLCGALASSPKRSARLGVESGLKGCDTFGESFLRMKRKQHIRDYL